jgi:hypothetical protein
MDLNDVLRHAVAAGASDVHLKVGQPPVLRTEGGLAAATGLDPLGDAELDSVLAQVAAAVPRPVPACDSTWDPTTDLIVFVAGSRISECLSCTHARHDADRDESIRCRGATPAGSR